MGDIPLLPGKYTLTAEDLQSGMTPVGRHADRVFGNSPLGQAARISCRAASLRVPKARMHIQEMILREVMDSYVGKFLLPQFCRKDKLLHTLMLRKINFSYSSCTEFPSYQNRPKTPLGKNIK
jgi:hypothetical protein